MNTRMFKIKYCICINYVKRWIFLFYNNVVSECLGTGFGFIFNCSNFYNNSWFLVAIWRNFGVLKMLVLRNVKTNEKLRLKFKQHQFSTKPIIFVLHNFEIYNFKKTNYLLLLEFSTHIFQFLNLLCTNNYKH